jgi:diaminopimelate decarboxylase
MSDMPTHSTITQFPISNDQLIIGGKTVTQHLQQGLSTPCYLYDAAVIANTIRTLREHLPEDIKLHYALKANPHAQLVQFMAQHVDGFDIASQGELQLALKTNINPQDISFAGPGKRDEELLAAIDAGIRINVESLGELNRIASLAKDHQPPRLSIRINPDFDLKGSGMAMGGSAKPFGIDKDQLDGVFHAAQEHKLVIDGLHIYAGSQCLDAQSIVDAQKASLDLALELIDTFNLCLSEINLGGGFGIPYFPGEQPLDISKLGEELSDVIDDFAALQPNVDIVIELGRYLVGEAGVYLTRILDSKTSRSETFWICDGGMHHHLAASGNLGQIIRKNYPVVNPLHVNQGDRTQVSITGPLCTPLDILAAKHTIGQAQVDDVIAVMQSGAYGASASPKDFLSHPHAAEVFIDERDA